MRDRFWFFIAYYLLPERLIYWCAIRVLAYATTGAYSSQVVPELTAIEALRRWPDRPRGRNWRR